MSSSDPNFYLIESTERKHGDQIVWWKPDKTGYTIYLEVAGHYSKDEAEEICEQGNINCEPGQEKEKMWSFADIDQGKAGYVCMVVRRP